MEKTSSKFDFACRFATEKHSGQLRKGVKVPYIVHPYEVAQILRKNGADEATIIAGVLHDTVEDTNTNLSEIKQYFGEEVAMIVDYCTEKKSLPYLERKFEHDQRIKSGPLKAKMVKCADCLSNLRSLYIDAKNSNEIWKVFNASRQDVQKHYYWSILAFKELEGMEMYEQLKKYYYLTFHYLSQENEDEKE